MIGYPPDSENEMKEGYVISDRNSLLAKLKNMDK
jgi:hypothetical protein